MMILAFQNENVISSTSMSLNQKAFFVKIISRNPLNRTKRYLKGKRVKQFLLHFLFQLLVCHHFYFCLEEHAVHDRIPQSQLGRLLNFCFFVNGYSSFLPLFHLLPVKAAEGT